MAVDVALVDAFVGVIVVLNVDLRLLVMEVEFRWVLGWWYAKIVLGCCLFC